jgi:hypothetical protein
MGLARVDDLVRALGQRRWLCREIQQNRSTRAKESEAAPTSPSGSAAWPLDGVRDGVERRIVAALERMLLNRGSSEEHMADAQVIAGGMPISAKSASVV